MAFDPSIVSVEEEAGQRKAGDIAEPRERVFSAGTLCYTRNGLVSLFGWLLWGDFAFTFFEAIFSRFLPLYLKDMQASNTLIGVMTGSIAGLVNVLFAPNFSQWSDRLRSRWGRRIPFLFWVTPITVVSLTVIGFAPELGEWLHGSVIGAWVPNLGKREMILTLMCIFVVSYHLFNMVLVNSYNWLLRDVVPENVMVRFLSWIRIVGTFASFVFLWLVFPHILTARKLVCSGIGVFYLISFMAMCWRVKEGEYPPPPERTKEGPGVIRTYARYFVTALRLPIYRYYFAGNIIIGAATSSAAPFMILFASKSLGLSMDNIGKIFAWGSLASGFAYIPMAWVCERIGALRITLISQCIYVVSCVLAYFLVRSANGWLIYSILIVIPSVAAGLGLMATTMALFPKESFGQFSSAVNVFGCGGAIVANYLIGVFMDLTNSNYRFVFVWSGIFFALGIFPLLVVYKHWKQHGGPHHYVPPVPDCDLLNPAMSAS